MDLEQKRVEDRGAQVNVVGVHTQASTRLRHADADDVADVEAAQYSTVAPHGPACLREILKRIADGNLRTWFPIEYRYVKADDIPLSMFEGRDSCAISVHQHYTMDHHNFFAAIEPIFWKYQGRPHWGKLHSLGARQLQALYPRWQAFSELRQALDPHGRLVNAHLAGLFGLA